jgi:hypothetical protein
MTWTWVGVAVATSKRRWTGVSRLMTAGVSRTSAGVAEMGCFGGRPRRFFSGVEVGLVGVAIGNAVLRTGLIGSTGGGVGSLGPKAPGVLGVV